MAHQSFPLPDRANRRSGMNHMIETNADMPLASGGRMEARAIPGVWSATDSLPLTSVPHRSLMRISGFAAWMVKGVMNV